MKGKSPLLTSSEYPIVALLMSITGFGEKSFWHLFSTLSRSSISLIEFWHLPAERKNYFLQEKFVKSVQKLIKEYKNNDYFEWLQERGISAIVWSSKQYPPLLATIDLPPPVLYVRGAYVPADHCLAVIGSRRMTLYGQLVIRKWMPTLSQAGLTIVSGGVVGVDQTAQNCALENNGQTMAVLGHGLLAAISQGQHELFSRWESQGACLMSPFAPFTAASKGTFLARNRIVAGLSLGVLVIEAAVQSGTSHTVRWAGEFGRTMMAVPGSIFNQFTIGTAHLVNQGVTLVTDPTTVIGTLKEDWPDYKISIAKVVKTSPALRLQLNDIAANLLETVNSNQWRYDELVGHLQTRWPLSELLTTLTELELAGAITREGEWVVVAKA